MNPRAARAVLAPAVLAASFAAVMPLFPLLRSADLLVSDLLSSLVPRRPALFTSAVLVDEKSLRRFGAWPWSRERLAQIVDAIRAGGARGVALDVLLPEPRDGDERLAAALGRIPSVLAAALEEDSRWLLPAGSLRSSASLAHVSFELDADGVARGFLSTKQGEGRSLPALAVAASRLVRPDAPVPVARPITPGFRVSPSSIPSIGVADLLEPRSHESALRGRVVFLGASAAGVGDRVVIPGWSGGSPVPGVLVHAAAAEAILRGDVLRPPPSPIAALATGFLVAAAAGIRRASRSGAAPLAILIALSPVPIAYVALLAGRLEVPAVTTSLSAVVVGAGVELLEMQALRRRAAIHSSRVAELEEVARSLGDRSREEAEARRVVAHELKTPLTSVRGLAQLLGGFDLTEAERRRVAAMVVVETSRLSEMVEALLDLERLKLKEFARVARPTDLSRLVSERLAALRAGSGREIRAEIDAGIGVVGEQALLARVVDNLVGNALKFSPNGAPVTVRVAQDAREALLEVEDRGAGVPKEARERIFRRFDRGGTPDAVPGLGLGLALVAEVVAWHRGRVEVEGGADIGSRFRVRLPLAG